MTGALASIPGSPCDSVKHSYIQINLLFLRPCKGVYLWWFSSFFSFKSSFWVGCLFSPECWIRGNWHLCLVLSHLSVRAPWAELATGMSSWQYQLLRYTTWATQRVCFPSATRWSMQLPGQQPSQQLFQGQKGWWQMSRYLMASRITRTFFLYLWWMFVREIDKAVTLSRDHADPQISRSIPPYSSRLVERVRIFCECQELVCKSNIFCCWIWHCKTQWREAGHQMTCVACHVDLVTVGVN